MKSDKFARCYCATTSLWDEAAQTGESSRGLHSQTRGRRTLKENNWKSQSKFSLAALLCSLVLCVLFALAQGFALAADTPGADTTSKATQASVERQVNAPSGGLGAPVLGPTSSSLAAGGGSSSGRPAPSKPSKQTPAQLKKTAALAAQQSYDRYQLKASPSSSSSQAAPADAKVAEAQKRQGEKQRESEVSTASVAKEGTEKARKKTATGSSSFALLKRLLPSFMSSAAAAAAVVSTASGSGSGQHSRSSPSSDSPLPTPLLGAGAASAASVPAKLMGLLTGASKKRHDSVAQSLIPNHAPVFMRHKVASDRQGGPAALASIASGLLSNPLGLGLLFSAPLLPSLLLTPLAIAGLSPAMSAINNFFGDDDDDNSSKPSGPLATIVGAASGNVQATSNSPLASIFQATGGFAPLSDLQSMPSTNSFALQAFQSLLGSTSTTARPLFNPGVFASSSGLQSAAANLANTVASSNQPQRASGFGSGSGSGLGLGSGGGSLLQAAASMISPSFAAPPTSSSSSSTAPTDDDGPGLMQMASDVFEKVANYMGTTQTGVESNKDIGQPSSPVNSPLSALASLSSLSPFQLSGLFAGTPLGTAASTSSGSSASSSSGSSGPQKAGFFSTLRNVYQLFSSSFLRRQAADASSSGDSNECQQRLICELHQRAMNSKLFRRSLQANLMELAQLDRNLLEQIKYSAQGMQARVDPDTKAMLNDFLKASNNFKSGRELVNCGQMFPKCSRVQLLAAANAHLTDPVNGRAIGKFSQLMKKMKFKTNQQHQSQWKLRNKANKLSPAVQQQPQQALTSVSQPPIDYLQVAPLGSQTKASVAQLTPADSLKLVQQIMLMSQQQQATSNVMPQQQQQQQQVPIGTQYNGLQTSAMGPPQQQPQQPQQQQYSAYNSQYQQQYSQPPLPQSKQTTYTDAIVPYTPATESPYYMPAQQQQQYTNSPAILDGAYGNSARYNAQQQQQQQTQQQQTNRQQQVEPAAVSQQQPQSIYYQAHQAAVADQQQPVVAQPSSAQDKSKQQQLAVKSVTTAAAAA